MSNLRTAAAAWLAAGFYGGTLMPASAAADPLAPLLWKVRPVVVLASDPGDASFRQQMAALGAKEKTLAGYDIKVLALTGAQRGLRQKLGLPATGFAVALVGKDGGVKESWTAPVAPARIFALIDRMPMRRDEVRARSR